VRQTGRELRTRAAVTIQRYYKGYLARMRFQQMRSLQRARQARQTRGEISKKGLSPGKERLQSNLYRATISMLNLKRAETRDFSGSKGFEAAPVAARLRKAKKESVLRFQNKVQKE
jgi:hypothetical protein